MSVAQETTQARPPQKAPDAPAPAAAAATDLQDPAESSRDPASSSYSPSLALLRLLQTAFNRQGPASQPRSQDRKQQQQRQQEYDNVLPAAPATRLPAQQLYQALDRINKYQGRENSLYSDYSDRFYSSKPYRHRDDRLLQAMLDMISDDSQ